MLCWFVGGACAVVWLVLRDPRIDYRLVAAGSLLPDVVDGPFGGARAAHSLVASVAVLAVVMAVTVGRRPARMRWLALPFGTFLHLVLDGAWADSRVFWWPFGGLSFGGARLGTVARGPWSLALEVVGVVIVVRAWRRFGLADPARRAVLVRTGALG